MDGRGQYGYSASRLSDILRDLLRTMGLAASLLVVACDGNAADEVSRRGDAKGAGWPVAVESEAKLLSGRSRPPPGISCSSQNFEAFLQAYANSADLQAAYTSESSTHKYPYYWKHNTEPGDPAYPKWVTEEERSVGRVKYRYDPESKKFIWLGKRLKDGQRWISIKADEKPVSFAQLPDFEIRRVSAEQYDVEYDKGEVDSYELKSGCWRFVQHLEFDRIMSCRWPDQCRACREWEGESDKRALCGAL